MENCTGLSLLAVNHEIETNKDAKKTFAGKGSRGHCAICDKRTVHYCGGCHQWYCIDTHNEDNVEFELIRVYLGRKEQNKYMLAWNTCHFQAHREAIERALRNNSLAGEGSLDNVATSLSYSGS